ncbi:hypothetical protein BHS06_12680 [Myxococcus xanthus]|uniref:6-pyruvoyl trahydropterin synthase family protein n=1 Tax=Myxococcus xanthus TaxID=34 RepID=UPI00112A8926|nr:6-carboxytetrahydropterin synthase [Myxococcus xanthus]QDE89748.1 hypothetical protein BHS06_12680 [Myxococcus xanthus]
MHYLSLTGEFKASHAVTFPDGQREPLHTHDWWVRVWVKARALNHWDVIIDFKDLQDIVVRVCRELHDTNINEHPYFKTVNCTAERITEYVFKQVESGLPEGVTLDRVHLRRTGGELPEAEYAHARD